MDTWVVISFIVVVGLVLIIWMLRDRLTSFTARGSMDKREAEVTMQAAPNQTQTAVGSPKSSHSVEIRGNTAIGKTKMDISQTDVGVEDNKFAGNTDLKVKPDQKKRR